MSKPEEQSQTITSADDLNKETLGDIDRTLGSIRAMIILNSTQKRLLRAQRRYWESADQATKDKLYQLFLAEPE